LYSAPNIITITKSKKCETTQTFYMGKLSVANNILVVYFKGRTFKNFRFRYG